MFDDWYRPNSTLEFPVGGSEAIVDGLVRGLEKNGGRLELRSHVEDILVEGGRAVGVTLRGGARIDARKAVVSNATVWDTLKILPDGAMPEEWVKEVEETEMCASFMHLHLGIDATGLPDDLEIHHIYVEDWDRGVTAEQNMVLVSIASVLDPSLAPEGKHVIHAYTPGNEPLDLWQGLDRTSEEYKALKKERAEVLWRAVEKAIPDVRSRVEIEMVGTPLTQQRFQRRHKGTYGGTGWITPDADSVPITTASTPLDGLLVVGDSNFPRPGVPLSPRTRVVRRPRARALLETVRDARQGVPVSGERRARRETGIRIAAKRDASPRRRSFFRSVSCRSSEFHNTRERTPRLFSSGVASAAKGDRRREPRPRLARARSQHSEGGRTTSAERSGRTNSQKC